MNRRGPLAESSRQPCLVCRPGSLTGDSGSKASVADVEGDNLR